MDGIRRKTSAPLGVKKEPTPREDQEVVVEETSYSEIRQIPHQDRIAESPFFRKPKSTTPQHVFETPTEPKESNYWILKLLLGVLVVCGGGFGLATYFASASVSITPFSKSASLDQDFTATKESTSPEALTFQFMSLTEEKEKEVPATTEQKIQKKASGKVIITNNYSKDTQRLIKNTRLETPDHKIYRIDQSVVVPGAKVSGGKIIEPGAVEAVVYADAPGEEYNLDTPTTFTIPGFMGEPRYAKFGAHSKEGSPIEGGFSGTVKVPSEEDVLKAQQDLKESLKTLALEKARAEIPAGVTFFPESIVLKFEEVPQEYTKDDKAKVAVRATVSVFFFDTALLTKRLAQASIPEETTIPLTATNLQNLKFTFLDPVDNVVLSDLTKLRFKVSGDVRFVGAVNTDAIGTLLAGKNKKEFTALIAKEATINKASMTMFPLWNTVFPEDPKKITVKVVSE